MDSFVLYRFPHQKEYIRINGKSTILQHYSELGNSEGFAVAPFAISDGCPLVLIVPEETTVSKVEFTNAGDYNLPNAASGTTANSDTYFKDFHLFHGQLCNGTFSKIVLARAATVENSQPAERLFMHACNLYPRLFIALVHTPQTGTWLTATPEILLENDGHNCHTMALAGTMKVGEIEWSEKNIEEQRIVARYIAGCISQYTDAYHEEGPYAARAGQVMHLRSDFTFRLKDNDNFGSLIEQLHPTPAVCGLPKQETYDFIISNESLQREYYSGFMGPVNLDGETHLYVTLRCMRIENGACRLYAGGGLLKDSDAQSEWNETEIKMETMKKAIYVQQ